MATTLIEAKDSIDRFLTESRQCAEQKLGFAAMLTTFPVMLSVAEAIRYNQKLPEKVDRSTDKTLFKDFVPQMPDKSWWITRDSTIIVTDQDIAVELYHLRNSLVHQHSLPNHIGLANIKSEVKAFLKKRPDVKKVICVIEFVEAVQKTIDRLIRQYPNVTLDPNNEGLPRSPAVRIKFDNTMPDLSKTETSGSGAGRQSNKD